MLLSGTTLAVTVSETRGRVGRAAFPELPPRRRPLAAPLCEPVSVHLTSESPRERGGGPGAPAMAPVCEGQSRVWKGPPLRAGVPRRTAFPYIPSCTQADKPRAVAAVTRDRRGVWSPARPAVGTCWTTCLSDLEAEPGYSPGCYTHLCGVVRRLCWGPRGRALTGVRSGGRGHPGTPAQGTPRASERRERLLVGPCCRSSRSRSADDVVVWEAAWRAAWRARVSPWTKGRASRSRTWVPGRGVPGWHTCLGTGALRGRGLGSWHGRC